MVMVMVKGFVHPKQENGTKRVKIDRNIKFERDDEKRKSLHRFLEEK